MRRLRELLGVGLILVVGCASAPVVVQAPPSVEEQATVAATPAPLDPAAVASQPAPAPAEPTAELAEPTAGLSQPTAVPPQTTAAASQPAAAEPQPAAVPPTEASPCDVTARPDPLPAPGSPNAQNFFRSFRQPLPPAPLYNPPGQKRVGLQAGHWLTDQVPAELGRLQGGAIGGGKQEWQVNLDVAQRAASLLESNGIQVDVLPATIPPHYQANAFIAIHADGDTTGETRGFKAARPGFSSIAQIDDQLVEAINQAYARDTELPRDDEHISLRMRYYYAFNSRRYCHAVAPGVPQAIVEMAYLTNATDRQYLIGDPDRLARGIADSVQAFLNALP